MPETLSLAQVLAVLVPVAVVTLLLRALPFSFIKLLKDSQLVAFLGLTMPVGVMAALVVYSISTQTATPGGLFPIILGTAVTLGIHLKWRDATTSIVGGTVFYMLLVNVFF